MKRKSTDKGVQSIIERFIAGDIPAVNTRLRPNAFSGCSGVPPRKTQSDWHNDYESAVKALEDEHNRNDNYYERKRDN